jgi:trigger factor
MVADLSSVDGRAAQPGDVAVVDILSDDGLGQRDYVIELGSDRLVDEIEDGILGLQLGETRRVEWELADDTRRHADVTLNQLHERVLPPLEDDLARTASEFDTVEELRGDIEGRIRSQLEDVAEGEFRAAAVDELVKASDVQPAGLVVEVRTRELLNAFLRSLEQRGISPAAYLQYTGATPEQLEARLRAEAAQSIARELVLEAVADKLAIEVTDDDIRGDLREGGESDEDIEEFMEAGGADRVRQDLRLKRALDRVAEEVKPISPDLAEAREKIWTPEQERPKTETKLWTPGS